MADKRCDTCGGHRTGTCCDCPWNDAQKRIKELMDAIKLHRDQRGDDRCWLDDQALYEVLKDGKTGNTALPPKEEFLGNCARYHACRQNPADNYQTLEAKIAAEIDEKVKPIITENELLKAKLKMAILGIEHIKKHALWGVEANCDAVIAFLKSE